MNHAQQPAPRSVARGRSSGPAGLLAGTFFERHAHNIQPEPNSGCWLWRGGATPARNVFGTGGYGTFRHDGKTAYAHRSAYEAVHGFGSSAGLQVRHSCDTPLCCNPDHLLLGTNADNGKDRIAHGRANVGERAFGAKLSRDDVRGVLALRFEGIAQKAIAEIYGVDKSTISLICTGRRWKQTISGDTEDIAEVMQLRAKHHTDLSKAA